MKTITISALNVAGLQEVADILSKGILGEVNIIDIYNIIGDILAENIHQLNLDRDTLQISAFARCIACEMMTERQQIFSFPHGCWAQYDAMNFPPFHVKDSDSKGLNLSDTKPLDKQKSAMIYTFSMILKNDPSFRVVADKLLTYMREHSLWTEEDELDID